MDFTLDDINDISYRVPCLSKVAPNGTYHIEDVHRAGGIPAILGELRRAGHLNLKVHTALYDNAEQWLDDWDIRNPHATDEARELYYAAPGVCALPNHFRNPTAGTSSILTPLMAAFTTPITPFLPTAAWLSYAETWPRRGHREGSGR